MDMNKKCKFIFITGGVVSSLGKGIASASLAALLQARGYKVRIRKLDPYLNIDPGTMSPHQHGEVFVTEDGGEADLDLGHYERFTGINTSKFDSITTGKIYSSVLKKERNGSYLGATIQVIPHITDEIKNFITSNLSNEDFLICEIGGTVGDIESLPFLEAIRQMKNHYPDNQILYIHLALLPYLNTAQEIKTKPAQHSVRELLRAGIQPNILLCRCEKNLSEDIKEKLALFCNLKKEQVIEAPELDSIYKAPLAYYDSGFDKAVCNHFSLNSEKINLTIWQNIANNINYISQNTIEPANTLTIAIVGKYMQLIDAYKSLFEALVHAQINIKSKVNLKWIDSENSLIVEELKTADAILIPGGFGTRGIEGKLIAAKYARENKIPFLGICLGMQIAIIEISRNLANIKNADSVEFIGENSIDNYSDVITYMNEQKEQDIGGSLRLGSYECYLQDNSLIASIYQKKIIKERHRHRYIINNKYKEKLKASGLKFVAFSYKDENNNIIEAIEYENHPWFIAVQFHPELKSRPFEPHPIFVEFLKAAKNRKNIENI